jgi:hypothetical protein
MPIKDVQLNDISAPEHGVQITVRSDGGVVWISVDGLTVTRISQIPYLEINLPDQTLTYGEITEDES